MLSKSVQSEHYAPVSLAVGPTISGSCDAFLAEFVSTVCSVCKQELALHVLFTMCEIIETAILLKIWHCFPWSRGMVCDKSITTA